MAFSPRFLSPLRQPLFRALWIANVFSNLGTWMHNMGASWLMTSLSPSPFMISLVQTATTLPMFMFAIPSGVVADLMDKRKFLFFTQVFMAIAALALGISYLTGTITAWGLLFYTFLISLGTAMNMPAWQAAVSGLMESEELPAMASLNNLSFNLGRTFGPALAGLIIGFSNTGWVFIINAISFIGVIWVFYDWSKTPITTNPDKENFRAALKGLTSVIKSKNFQRILIRTFSAFFFGTGLWSLLPAVAKDIYFCDANGFSLLLTSLGVGAVLAAVILPRFRLTHSSSNLVLNASVLFGVVTCLSVATPYLFFFCLLLLLAGLAWGTLVAQLNAAAQLSFPLAKRSRALAVYFVTLYGGLAFGSLLWGQLAVLFGLKVTLLWVGSGMILVAFLVRRYKF